MKVKVTLDRENCIGSVACVTILPEFWKFNETEGKIDLVNSKKINENEYILELDVNEEELKKHLEAARSCPVNVIHVVNLETNEKLV